MGTLEITVRLQSAGVWPVVAEYSSDDDPLTLRAEGALALDPAALAAVALEPRAYGSMLGQALFRDDIAHLFESSLARVGNGSLRLLLFIEDPGLRAVRWERLCALIEKDWQPLATYQRVPFSRYLPSQADRRFPPISRHDMRALIVAASPARSPEWGLPVFDEAAAVAGVIAALDAAGVSHSLLCSGPGGAGPPTLDAICEQISRERITMLHIVAHGRSLEDGSVIYFSRADNPAQIDAVTTTRLIDRLNDLRTPFGLPHLAFLCACESAQEEHNGSLGGLAQQLVLRLGTPAVVAMADRVSVATATALASAFYGQLLEPDGEAEGAVDLALVKATAGLAEREDVTVPVLFNRLGARPLFTRAAQRAPDPEQVASGLEELAGLVARRAPVLEPELEVAAAVVQTHLGADVATLGPEAQSELLEARSSVETICAEAVELTFAALATGTPPPPYEGDTCPFPGLTAFSEEQHRFFFGREALMGALLEQLERKRFLAISGPSGSGKSSLVLAGILPSLRAKRPGLGLVYLTPGEFPLANLERAIYEAQQHGERERTVSEPQSAERELVVVIDQLEELFLFGAGELAEREERLPFIKRLRSLAEQHLVMLTVRTDFLDECGRYAGLNGLLTGNTVQVQPLSAEELRAAAERQAAAVGLRFEAGLTAIILNEVRDERGAMPLAQHALRELWQRRRGRWLRTSEYVALGGIKEAIARTADQIFARHNEEGQQRLREIFLRLTRVDRDPDPAGETSDTRQRVSLEELVPDGEPSKRIEELLRQLGEARLVMHDRGQVEVAHEALIRSWRRLREWLDDDRQLLVQLDDLRQAASAWKRGGQADYFLWAGQRLAQAELLAHLPRFKLNTPEKAFLDASVEARHREQEEQAAQLQRERELRAAAEASRQQAEHEAQRAREAAAAADHARALATEAQRLAEENARKAGLARDESLVERTRAEAARLHALEQAQEAERQRDIARSEEERARAAEAVVRGQTRQLRRGFWLMAGLAGLACLLAGGIFWQVGQTRQQAAESERRALIADAVAALGRGEPDEALSLAARAPDDPRFTRVLNAAASSSARRIHAAFEDTVNSVAFSPDGATYLAAAADGWLRIWDRAGGAAIHQYRAMDGDEPTPLTALAFGVDGPVVGTADGRLIAVNATAGEPFDGAAADQIWALAASPDGALLLSGDNSGGITLWDVQQRAWSRSVAELPESSAVGVGFLDDGRSAYAVGSDGVVTLFDTSSWEQSGSFELRLPDGPDFDGDLQPDACLVWSTAQLPTPDGEQLLVGCNNGVIQAWSPEGTFTKAFFAHDAAVLSLAPLLHQDGSLGFVSSSYDQTVRIWDYEYAISTRQLLGHDAEVYSLAVSPTGEQLVSGSFDRTARLWDIQDGLLVRSYARSAATPIGSVVALAAPNDGSLVIADQPGALASWDLASGALAQSRELPGEPIALSADGRRALVRLPDNQVAFWDVAGHRELAQFAAELPDTVHAALSADGAMALIALQGGDSELRAADGSLLHTFPGTDGVASAFAFSPDGARALIAYLSREIALVSLPDGAAIGERLTGHTDEVTSLAFSPDGQKAISGSWDKTAMIWQFERPGPMLVLRSHIRTVSAVAFSPDGRLALTGSYDRTARLWSVTSGLELATYGSHQDVVGAVAFSPDGQQALTASAAGEVLSWRAFTGEALLAWLRANRAMPASP